MGAIDLIREHVADLHRPPMRPDDCPVCAWYEQDCPPYAAASYEHMRASRINTAHVHGMDLYDAVYELVDCGALTFDRATDSDRDVAAAICHALLDVIAWQCGDEQS